MLEEEGGHGRDEEDESGPFGLHRVEPDPGVEAREVDPLEPELHRRVDEGEAGEGVRGAGVQPAAAAPLGRLERDERGVVVSDGHRLGVAGGPRRVEDVGQVPGRGVPGSRSGRRRRAGPIADLGRIGTASRPVPSPSPAPGTVTTRRRRAGRVPVGERLLDQRRHGPAVVEHPLDLGPGELGVEGHGHRPGPVDGRVGDHPPQGIGRLEVEGHPVRRFDPGLEQTTGDRRVAVESHRVNVIEPPPTTR